MSDDRLKAVAAAFRAHHGDPEDIESEGVAEAQEVGAIRQAALFLAMLDAAQGKTAEAEETAEGDD